MDTKKFLAKMGHKAAILYVKKNPGLVINSLESRFASDMKKVTVEGFEAGITKNLNLFDALYLIEAPELNYYLATPQARETYRTVIKPRITDALILGWLKKHRVDMHSFVLNYPAGEAKNYILKQFRVSLVKLDEHLEKMERGKLIAPNTFLIDGRTGGVKA